MKNIVLFITIFICSNTYAQIIMPSVIVSGGDYFSSTNAEMSISIGEIVTETIQSDGTILTQGFQQPHFNVVFVESITSIDNIFEIFPIPASTEINIQQNISLNSYRYTILDISGKELLTGYSNETLNTLNISELSSGIYFMFIYLSNQNHYNFKLIKE